MANERARHPRQSMTPQEVKLWVHLRSWRSRGYHFRRQDPRDPYIVDFVCRRHRLIVEVDGGQHNFDEQVRRDRRRDCHLERQGFKVLRYWNFEIDRNLDGVLEDIDRELGSRGPNPTPALRADPPLAGEG